MKKLFLGVMLILTMIIGLGCMHIPKYHPVSKEDLVIQKVVNIPGFTKNQIFEQSKIWIAMNFKSAKAVIEYENKEQGTLIGNGILPNVWSLCFTMKIDIKDEKLKVSFINLGYAGYHVPIVRVVLDKAKPRLLEIPDRIVLSIIKAADREDW